MQQGTKGWTQRFVDQNGLELRRLWLDVGAVHRCLDSVRWLLILFIREERNLSATDAVVNNILFG